MAMWLPGVKQIFTVGFGKRIATIATMRKVIPENPTSLVKKNTIVISL